MDDEWDDLVADAFELLSDLARYTVARTGTTHEVRVIPIDEAETWAAKRGDLQATGSKVIARIQVRDLPEGWRGPDVAGEDRLQHKGVAWRVQPVRTELNGVWVVELVASKR